ncbi:sterile alpha motif domain-containing protein 13 isoform X3 [Oryctolagus cuniculus]|uniref:sterile alpha motif domain-containing protein 13 isoform X3 n=1 Tax=Oryctolagus cuniculus TaxID=9986 RepID=UPI0038791EF6
MQPAEKHWGSFLRLTSYSHNHELRCTPVSSAKRRHHRFRWGAAPRAEARRCAHACSAHGRTGRPAQLERSEYGPEQLQMSSVENGRPPDPADWAVMDVVNYFRTAGFEEQANVFQEQEIDGKSLLLMTRNDVLTGLQLKLGPALKIYEYHVKPLQTKHLKNSSS